MTVSLCITAYTSQGLIYWPWLWSTRPTCAVGPPPSRKRTEAICCVFTRTESLETRSAVSLSRNPTILRNERWFEMMLSIVSIVFFCAIHMTNYWCFNIYTNENVRYIFSYNVILARYIYNGFVKK